jgi:hypothetical protein
LVTGIDKGSRHAFPWSERSAAGQASRPDLSPARAAVRPPDPTCHLLMQQSRRRLSFPETFYWFLSAPPLRDCE